MHAIVDRKLNGHANELFKALGPPPAELVELVRQKLATRLAPGTNGLQAKHGGNGGECERLTCGG